MKQRIQKLVSDLFYKSRNNRIYQARKVGYRNILKMHYDPELTVDGETGYFKLWKQLTNKIEPYSYRLFSHFMGKVPYIIPDYIGTEILSYYLNPRRYSDFYEDKNTYSSYVLLENALPKTYLKRIGGVKYYMKIV